MTLTITIDHKKPCTTFKAGKILQSLTMNTSPSAVAGVWRDVAAYALEMAFNAEHSLDVEKPIFTDTDRQAQALYMLDEHKNIFEQELTIHTK